MSTGKKLKKRKKGNGKKRKAVYEEKG